MFFHDFRQKVLYFVSKIDARLAYLKLLENINLDGIWVFQIFVRAKLSFS